MLFKCQRGSNKPGRETRIYLAARLDGVTHAYLPAEVKRGRKPRCGGDIRRNETSLDMHVAPTRRHPRLVSRLTRARVARLRDPRAILTGPRREPSSRVAFFFFGGVLSTFRARAIGSAHTWSADSMRCNDSDLSRSLGSVWRLALRDREGAFSAEETHDAAYPPRSGE